MGKTKRKLLVLVVLAFLLVNVGQVFGVCTTSLNKDIFSPGETATATSSCDSGNERNRAYTLTWSNFTDGNIEADVGTTPGTAGQAFIETFSIPLDYPVGNSLNITLTGTNLEGTDNSTIAAAGSNSLIFPNITLRGTFLGLSSSVDATVTDENDKKITGGTCNIAVEDPTNSEVLQVVHQPMANGEVTAQWILDYERFSENKDYLVELTCFCGSNSSIYQCIDEDGVSVFDSVGSVDSPFTTSTWIEFHQSPLTLSNEDGEPLNSIEVNLTAGFDHAHWIENITNNNPLGEPMEARISTLLINNDTGTGFGIVNEGNTDKTLRGFINGNSSSVRNHLLAKDAPDGIYFVLTKVDLIYKGQFQVAQYLIQTDFFNITSLNSSLQILDTEVHDFFDVEVNLSSTIASSTTIPLSNNTDPFYLLTEGFGADFCINITNKNSDDAVVFLDHLRLENPTLGTNHILITEETGLKSSVDGDSNEEPCFSVELPLDLVTHSDYRFAFEAHVGTVDGPFICGEACIFEGHTDNFYVAVIEDMISIDKFIREPNSTDLGRPGVFIVNHKGQKVFMLNDRNYTSQAVTSWDNATAQCSGKDNSTDLNLCDLSVYPVAGSESRVCFEGRNYFSQEVFISIGEITMDSDQQEDFFTLTGQDFTETAIKSITDDDLYVNTTPSRLFEGDGNLTDGYKFFCTDPFTIPGDVVGGNNWDVQMEFSMDEDVYVLPEKLSWLVESDEFPIFGRLSEHRDWALHIFDPIHYNIPEVWTKITSTEYVMNLTIPFISGDAQKFTIGEHLHRRLLDQGTPLERVENITVTYKNGSRLRYNFSLSSQFDELIIFVEDVDFARTDNNFTFTATLTNLEEVQTEALLATAGRALRTTRLNSDYFGAEFIATVTRVETELMQFYINMSRGPDFGQNFLVRYDFFAREGDGERVDSIETEVVGLGNHSIFLRSSDLNPTGASENYSVVTTVSMKNGRGLWEEFSPTSIGHILINSLGVAEGGGSGGGGGKAGFYDVIVDVVRNKYEFNDVISAKITLFNTGDIPDQDTILVYFLTDPNGNVFGKSQEQFLEFPPGKKVLERSIALPSGAVLGEWRFNVEYFTVVQPVIEVFDSFEVVESLTFLERLQDVSSFVFVLGILGLAVVFSFYIARREEGTVPSYFRVRGR